MAHRAAERTVRSLRLRRVICNVLIASGLSYIVATAGAGMAAGNPAPVTATLQSIDQSVPAPTTPASPTAGGRQSSGMGGTAQQELVVPILPGGPLQVTPDHVTVELHAVRGDPGTFVGELGPVVLIDPRGSLAGWHVYAQLVGADAGNVLVGPGQPIAVAGRQSEVRHSDRQSATVGADAVLMRAPRGGGGGTFSVSAAVIVRGADPGVDHSVTFSITTVPVVGGGNRGSVNQRRGAQSS